MPKQWDIQLSPVERSKLEAVRDTGKPAYLRERAAAVLKVADGQSATFVAHHGLLKRRKINTVCDWLHAYIERGIAGLKIAKGRGRKPTFSPSNASDRRHRNFA